MLPYMVPAQAFHDAIVLSPLWNKLVDAVARDVDWLHSTLELTTKSDPFTKRLVDISKTLHKDKLRQEMMLGIHRSDYMLHEPEGGAERPHFLQVELNTIASSMASHSFNTSALHRYMLDRYGSGNGEVGRALREHYGTGAQELVGRLPPNETLKQISAGLAAAHRAYSAAEAPAVVLFVVQEGERNFADQRWIEYALWEEHGVPVVRKSLAELRREASLDAATGKLLLDGGMEISVVYFRAGYSPDDYPTEAEWEARELLERSLAIKCPSVDYQLAGTKKVQQALARPGTLERFMNARESAKLRTCFAGLWGLGPGEDDASIIEEARGDPHAYVLKPQREGGGNNFYGQDLAAKLKELSSEERAAYILMQRILPRRQTSVMTRGGQAIVEPGLSEFGFYSVFLGDGRRVLMSQHAGHLVRTKAEGVDEGGVAAGYAVISSPFLVR
uniref:Glutathione synthetase n=1 Tax=Alexandrium catenella TaxID=2925 RepID=A0A7S1RY77_ALECA